MGLSELMVKRYYVGSKDIAIGGSNWLTTTKEDSIKRAQELCQQQNTPQIVVEIVAYIEPKPQYVTYDLNKPSPENPRTRTRRRAVKKR